MSKLFAHVVIAALLIVIAGYFGAPWWLLVLLVLLGAGAVHFVWEMVFPDRVVHLGARAIADDDPLMIAALAQAKRTWPQFAAIYPQHRENSIVKFRLNMPDGTTENVWGDLVDLFETEARVYLRTPPVAEIEVQDRNMTVGLDDIVDWQVVFEDGSLRGGFTQRATFQIFEREEGHLPAAYMEQLQRYKEL